jgi:hypothetical protein
MTCPFYPPWLHHINLVSTSYGALHYAVFSRLLLFHPPWVQMYSSPASYASFLAFFLFRIAQIIGCVHPHQWRLPVNKQTWHLLPPTPAFGVEYTVQDPNINLACSNKVIVWIHNSYDGCTTSLVLSVWTPGGQLRWNIYHAFAPYWKVNF